MRGTFFKRLLRDDRGATAVEYGLIAALIVVVIVGAINGVASANAGVWGDVADAVVGAVRPD